MHKLSEHPRPCEPTGQPQPAEPDFIQPSSDEPTCLPLPDELHDPQPPDRREVGDPKRYELEDQWIRERLIGLLRQRYALSHGEAEAQVQAFLEKNLH